MIALESNSSSDKVLSTGKAFSDKTGSCFGFTILITSSILFPSTLIKLLIVLTAEGITSIAAGTRLIIAAANLGSIVIF